MMFPMIGARMMPTTAEKTPTERAMLPNPSPKKLNAVNTAPRTMSIWRLLRIVRLTEGRLNWRAIRRPSTSRAICER